MFPNQAVQPQQPQLQPQPRQRQRSLWDRIWRDRRGNIVIYQRPNVWLIIWVLIAIISLFVNSKDTANILWYISLGVLTIWSMLEIVLGVNYFRRAFGVFILLLIVLQIVGVGL